MRRLKIARRQSLVFRRSTRRTQRSGDWPATDDWLPHRFS